MENTYAGNFIHDIVDQDIAAGKTRVHTRFPPEPNGYLHIGSLKAVWINYTIAKKYGGKFNLRFDDTNPAKESDEFVVAMKDSIHWMGFEYDGGMFFGSDYFDKCYEYAVLLIKKGLAFVCDLAPEDMRKTRGTLKTPGVNSPYRERGVEENLDLFGRMRAGEFPDGSRVLRAKIDMSSPNMNMRDPAIYRILHKTHHHTGDKWCIYPMYDYAHPIQDAIEGITHSCCSLEFEDHRPLYDWVINSIGFEDKPRQIEFARLNITRTVTGKRYLRQLVEGKFVDGWDDPRMPTIVGLRRRGYTPEALVDFLTRAGVAKANSVVDIGLMEHCVREDLGKHAPRAMAVIDPIKVVLANWEDGKVDELTMENHPDHPEMGEHKVKMGREIYIERDDFMIDPPGKFFRLKPGGEVRLKGAYIIKCENVVTGEDGRPSELHCTVDFSSRSGSEGSGRKVKGTIHWVDAATAIPAEFRLYDYMLSEETEDAGDVDGLEETEDAGAKEFTDNFNHQSKIVARGFVEPAIAGAAPLTHYQFLRLGYFVADPDTAPGKPVFNRVVGLKDTYAKAKEQ